jgi:dihydrofolate reductase
MGKVILGMMVSLDGYVEDTRQGLEWVLIDEELHTFVNERERQIGTFVYGRRMYEIMAAYWPTAVNNPSLPAFAAEYAKIWVSKPKIVFSTSLERVEGKARLLRGGLIQEVERLKAQTGVDISLGGVTLAEPVVRQGLVDQYELYVNPVVLGGGKRLFPALEEKIDLKLVETRTFQSGVIFLCYQRAADEKKSDSKESPL